MTTSKKMHNITKVVDMPTVHQNNLINSVSSLFSSSKYSDLTIHCGSDVYKLHRAIICPRSEFFAAACDSGFKESLTAEIILDDDDQSTVRRMLTYLYTLDYDEGDAFPAVATAVSQNTDSLVKDPTSKPDVVDDATVSHCKRMNNIRVYALAEKYDIPALKKLAKTKFEKHEPTCDPTHYLEVIRAIFDTTPETDLGLREIVILRSAMAGTLKCILKEDSLASVISDHSSLGLGILREVLKRHGSALGSLHHDALQILIPAKQASYEEFERSRQALEEFQEKLLTFWNDVKLED